MKHGPTFEEPSLEFRYPSLKDGFPCKPRSARKQAVVNVAYAKGSGVFGVIVRTKRLINPSGLFRKQTQDGDIKVMCLLRCKPLIRSHKFPNGLVTGQGLINIKQHVHSKIPQGLVGLSRNAIRTRHAAFGKLDCIFDVLTPNLPVRMICLKERSVPAPLLVPGEQSGKPILEQVSVTTSRSKHLPPMILQGPCHGRRGGVMDAVVIDDTCYTTSLPRREPF